MDDLLRLKWENAARQSIARFAQLVDARRMDDCTALFAEDAEVEIMGTVHSGRTEIRAWLRSIEASPAGKHMVSNIFVTVSENGRVEAESDLMLFKPRDGKFECEMRGIYHDRFLASTNRLLWQGRRLEVILPR